MFTCIYIYICRMGMYICILPLRKFNQDCHSCLSQTHNMHLQNVPRAQQKNLELEPPTPKVFNVPMLALYMFESYDICSARALLCLESTIEREASHFSWMYLLSMRVATQKSNGRRCPEKHMSA